MNGRNEHDGEHLVFIAYDRSRIITVTAQEMSRETGEEVRFSVKRIFESTELNWGSVTFA